MKKTLSIVLIISMIISCLAFVGCKEEESETEKKVVSSDESMEAALEKGDIFAERAAVDDGLDDGIDFGGKTLRVVCHNDGYEMFPAAEDINKGDLIKDAKVTRNKAVEDKLNCKIELAYNADITTLSNYVSKAILSGSDEFDLIVNHLMTAGSMVPKNLFINWYDVPHVDFSKPWWAASNAEELTYDGKAILAISDLNATAITCTCILIFNKNLANAWDVGNLYELVLDGNWTYDAMYSMLKDIYMDTDGSGDRTEGDFYGATFNIGSTTNAWIWAFDNPCVAKNEDGVPTFVMKTDKINPIMQTVYDIYYNTSGIYAKYEEGENKEYSMFLNKQSILTAGYLSYVASSSLRDFEDDYGILPFPKWNEYQKEYHSHVYGEHTCMAIPKTAKDLEFIGVCSEALAYESWKTLTPTIYEIAFKTRYLRDSESKKVLDIVLDNRYFDFDFVYNSFSSLGYTPYYMMRAGDNNFESTYSKRYNNARLSLKKVIKAFDKLD